MNGTLYEWWNVERKSVRKTILFTRFCIKTIIPYVCILNTLNTDASALTKSVCFISLLFFSKPYFESCKTNVQHYKYAIGENLKDHKAIQNTTLVNDSFVCVLRNLYVINIMHDVPIEIVCTQQIIK